MPPPRQKSFLAEIQPKTRKIGHFQERFNYITNVLFFKSKSF